MTARARLVHLVPPPIDPVDARGDWAAVETALGVRLPDDYKWLVEAYGWGEFGDVLHLRTPFGTNGCNGHNGIEWQKAHPADSAARDRERYPHPLHPAPGALLVWGATIDADRLCLLTAGAPEDWPIVVWSSEGWYETHPMGAAEFVERWTDGRLVSRLLASMEPDLAPWFNTFRPRTHRCLRLSESRFAHPVRLRLLREALAPTVDRGRWESDAEDEWQHHLATVEHDWLLTYEAPHPHTIRVDFPPEDADLILPRLLAAVRHMGCEVLRITTAAGIPLPDPDTAMHEQPPAPAAPHVSEHR
ncbi:SMI1/KNR4 family protein [Embleya sp. NPDC008237]|uniref:SMI1/KNR4 family protein n=1 Tax=Embleya sp. NPDC008237 TaxID=3363978 RepID=UPI0036EF0A18